MVPPDAFSISSAQARVAGVRGCAGGTQSEIFSSTVLSSAIAGVGPCVTRAAQAANAQKTAAPSGLPRTQRIAANFAPDMVFPPHHVTFYAGRSALDKQGASLAKAMPDRSESSLRGAKRRRCAWH